MFYFAYGSNMLTARLAERVPTVRLIGRGWLAGHRLYFHLNGSDESGKCNILHTGDTNDLVHGALYELDADRLDRLHAAEGPPYAFLELEIGTPNGPLQAATYRGRADYLDDTLVPFDWYRDFVVHGAYEHGLPGDYIAGLEAVTCQPDPDAERSAHNRRILRHIADNVIRAS
jgi:gamma-glutamylcyclotransferase (GGCT)/AIG2-like uncharacterized protein YtfP